MTNERPTNERMAPAELAAFRNHVVVHGHKPSKSCVLCRVVAEIDARGDDVRALQTRLRVAGRAYHSSAGHTNIWEKCKDKQCREDSLFLIRLAAHYDLPEPAASRRSAEGTETEGEDA